MTLTKRETCLEHERRLVAEAKNAVIKAAQADPDMDWSNSHMVLKVHLRQREIGWETARKHRATLINVTPATPGGKRLATFCSSWPLNDLAGCCTEVYDVLRRYLMVQARNHNGSDFDPTNDIVCLSGLEATEAAQTRAFPVFDNIHKLKWTPSGALLSQVLARQVVAVGCLQDDASIFDNLEHRLRCPSLHKVYPPMASLKRIAFEFRPEVGVGGDAVVLSIFHYCHRVGFKALRPFNLPGLQELYLIDESIKLNVTAVGQRLKEQLDSIPSFAGYFGTFYEVDPTKTDLWDIPTTDAGQMLVFLCARYLETGTFSPGGPFSNPPLGVPVKVLAFVRHTK
jgi:hypothetical protein